jgi:hypothetical protein
MKSTSEFLSHIESSPDLKKKLSGTQSASDLLRLATDAGFQANPSTLSQAMRGIAESELQKRGFPAWAVNSLLLGEAVCW